MKQKLIFFGSCLLLVAMLATFILVHPISAQLRTASGNGDWSMFMGDLARSGANLNESTITSATAGFLKVAWKFATGSYVVASPAIVNGVLYDGSWDGNEYAIDVTTHQQLWKTFLGITHQNKSCYDPYGVGVTSSAAVVNNVVYIGGGNGYMYALNASNGAVIWKTFLGAPPYYNWASPLVYNNRVYTGLAAFCDPPWVQGQVVALNTSNGSVAAYVSLVPNGQAGAPVWASPALDPASNKLYVATGGPGGLSTAQQTNAESLLALDATTLQIVDHWQIPASDQATDVDFGAAPTLFDVNGAHYIGALNKNGIYYVLNRDNLAAGSIWKQNLVGPPNRQEANVASSCYNNGVIYVGSAGVHTTGAGGSVHAFNATTGQQLWSVNTVGPVQASMMCTNGLVIDAEYYYVEVRNASNGALLFQFKTGNRVQATPVISNGMLFVGSRDGYIYAFAPR